MRSSSRPTVRVARTTTLVSTLAAALVLSGCSATGTSAGSAASATASAAPVKNGASQVSVRLVSSGGTDRCEIDFGTAKAGPVTFTVKNVSSSAISEVELLSNQRIIGEKENLAPGLAATSFTLTLTGGTYQLYCPGAATETQTFRVTGAAAAAPTGSVQTILTEGAASYGEYVATTVSGMVTAVGRLKTAVDSGDVAAAKRQYALARPFYEKIESDVEGFVLAGYSATDNRGNLDYLIDMRASNLDPAVGWHGFHAIERDLWKNGKITASTKKLAAELSTNVGKLATLSKTLEFKPEDLANGAAGLLEEVQSGKISGEEEAYSHLDLVDFAANVEGAQQAFAALKPGLTKIDAQLTKQISTQFDAVDALLDEYRDSAALGGYKAYTAALKATDASTLSRGVQALQVPLSKIAEKVATAK